METILRYSPREPYITTVQRYFEPGTADYGSKRRIRRSVQGAGQIMDEDLLPVRLPDKTQKPKLAKPIKAHGKASARSLTVLRAADRYAYTGCASTAYCYLFYLGTSKYIYTQENLVGREPVSCD
jgi:hypothetical protein